MCSATVWRVHSTQHSCIVVCIFVVRCVHIVCYVLYRFRFLVRLGVLSASWLATIDGLLTSMMIGISFAFGTDSSLFA